jgi:hypothetical protein
MEENLVEKLTAIRDALERGKLIHHRFEALGKGPKLGEHLMLMGAKEQKWKAQEGNVKQELKQDWKQRMLRLQELSKKSSTPLPVYNALLPPGIPSSSAVPNHSSRLLFLLLLFALLLLRFLLLLKLLPLT